MRSVHSLFPRSDRRAEMHSCHRSSCWGILPLFLFLGIMYLFYLPTKEDINSLFFHYYERTFFLGQEYSTRHYCLCYEWITYSFQFMACNDSCHRQLHLRMLQFLLLLGWCKSNCSFALLEFATCYWNMFLNVVVLYIILMWISHLNFFCYWLITFCLFYIYFRLWKWC